MLAGCSLAIRNVPATCDRHTARVELRKWGTGFPKAVPYLCTQAMTCGFLSYSSCEGAARDDAELVVLLTWCGGVG